MKKFTKVCLAVALITFLTGCLLGCVGAMLGGLRQMERVSVEQLTGIPKNGRQQRCLKLTSRRQVFRKKMF